MKFNPVGWFEIYVQDMPRARAFYETVFGVRLDRLDSSQFEMWGFPMSIGASGTSGAIVKMEGKASGNNSTVVYFRSPDCSVEAARVVPAGGTIIRERFAIGRYGYVVIASDPDGNVFGLHSRA